MVAEGVRNLHYLQVSYRALRGRPLSPAGGAPRRHGRRVRQGRRNADACELPHARYPSAPKGIARGGGVVAGACSCCAKAFGVKDVVEATDIPLLAD